MRRSDQSGCVKAMDMSDAYLGLLANMIRLADDGWASVRSLQPAQKNGALYPLADDLRKQNP